MGTGDRQPGCTGDANDAGRECATAVFADAAAALAQIVAPDVIVAAADLDPTQADPDKAPLKRAVFLETFLPFVRRRLSEQPIVDIVSAYAGLPGDVSLVLLRNVIKSGGNAALDVLLEPHRSANSLHFDAVGVDQWWQLLDYSSLRNSLPASATPLIELLRSCGGTGRHCSDRRSDPAGTKRQLPA